MFAVIRRFGRQGILDCLKCAVELGDYVVDMLEADGEADQLGQDAALPEVLVGELRVRRRCRMYDKRLRVSASMQDV